MKSLYTHLHHYPRLLLCSAFLLACGSGSSNNSADAGVDPDGATSACELGETRCTDDGEVQTCEELAGELVFGASEPCEENSVCAESACEEVSERKQEQGSALRTLATHIDNLHGYYEPIAIDDALEKATRTVFLGDGGDMTFMSAAYSILLSVFQGHGFIYFGNEDFSDCRDPSAEVATILDSWYGVCARRAGSAAIVTRSAEGNSLGLSAGDLVVGATIDGVSYNEDFLAQVSELPICGPSHSNLDSRYEMTAGTLFALVDEGDTLNVRKPDGSELAVTVGPRDESFIRCNYTFLDGGTSTLPFFMMDQREDGVVVITLPSVGSHPDHPFPQPFDAAGYRQWIADAVTMINEEFQTFENVTSVIWDVRGNTGGSQELAMALLGPLGEEGSLGNCYARVPESSPVEFSEPAEYPFPYDFLASPPLPSFEYDGLMAVVADGISVSAADWFLYRAAARGLPIIGHGAQATYGYRTGPSYQYRRIEGVDGVHPGISLDVSGAKCLDAEGVPLEGRVFLTEEVDLDPQDLSQGIDTQLERAIDSIPFTPGG